MKLEIEPYDTIHDAANIASYMARELNYPSEFEFNGMALSVNPGATPERVVEKYNGNINSQCGMYSKYKVY